MYTFKKGSDTALLEDNKVQLHISIITKEVDGTYLIEIPSLDIHTYTVNETDIDNRIDESLSSFFKYWLKIEGKEKLIEHMLALGFNLSKSPIIRSERSINSKRNIKRAGIKRVIDEELLIA